MDQEKLEHGRKSKGQNKMLLNISIVPFQSDFSLIAGGPSLRKKVLAVLCQHIEILIVPECICLPECLPLFRFLTVNQALLLWLSLNGKYTHTRISTHARSKTLVGVQAVAQRSHPLLAGPSAYALLITSLLYLLPWGSFQSYRITELQWIARPLNRQPLQLPLQ